MTKSTIQIKRILLTNLLFCCIYLNAQDKCWPQFRGKSASGHSEQYARPPVSFSLEKNLLWKTELPIGHSSPCIWGDNIFLTGFLKEHKELQTICINRRTGEIRWRKSVFPDKIERTHAISNPAIATPTTDGERVFVYFGSFGILCYDFDGNLIWEKPMPIPRIWYGASTSPVCTKDVVLLSHDVHNNSYLLALDNKTGREVWKTDLPKMGKLPNTSSYSTPMIMNNQVVLHRCWEISGYSLEDGERLWYLPAPSSGISTPTFYKNTIYTGTWQEYGEKDRVGVWPEFEEMLANHDSNKDSLIEKDEIPKELLLFSRPGMSKDTWYIYRIFRQIDEDRNGFVNKEEWVKTMNRYKSYYDESGLLAFEPNEDGELSSSLIKWKIPDKVPEVPSPIYCKNKVYMIKNGGLITCVNAESGDILYQDKLGTPGAYLASPVTANENIYIPAGNGVITVIDSGEKLNILAKNDLHEKIYATPAIIGNVIYVRTAGNICAFGK